MCKGNLRWGFFYSSGGCETTMQYPVFVRKKIAFSELNIQSLPPRSLLVSLGVSFDVITCPQQFYSVPALHSNP